MLKRQIGRRIMYGGLARGFTAWTELYEAKVYALEKLRSIGNRLRAPAAAIAWSAWAFDMGEDKRERGMAGATGAE